MFDSQQPSGKGSRATMLLVIGIVFAVLGLMTWYFTQ
jgi:hypothetical protein